MPESVLQRASLPHSEESERAVLAGVLLAPEQFPLVAGRLRDEDFHSDRHRLLFRAMVEVRASGAEIDLRTLQAHLEQQDLLERIGGVAYLASLDLDLPDLGRLDTYVEIVKERAVRRRLIDACGRITRDCLDGGLEAQAALGHAEELILKIGEDAVQAGFAPISEVVQETLRELEDRQEHGLVGLETGFRDIDRMTQGLAPGNLIVLAGRPGMGKTTLALNIAQYAALHCQKSVAIFSLEMSRSELAMRLLASETGIPFASVRSAHLSTEQWKQLQQQEGALRQARLHIDDSASPTLLEVASKARRVKAEHGLDLVVLDYLQLMQAGGRYENRTLEIAAITRGLKQMSKELEIPVLALSQLSRQPERRGGDHRPQLADLRESGSIEQDADVVAFVYRDWLYSRDTETRNQAELLIAKNRHGETGSVSLVFLGETVRFRSAYRGGDGPAA